MVGRKEVSELVAGEKFFRVTESIDSISVNCYVVEKISEKFVYYASCNQEVPAKSYRANRRTGSIYGGNGATLIIATDQEILHARWKIRRSKIIHKLNDDRYLKTLLLEDLAKIDDALEFALHRFDGIEPVS